MDLDDYTYPTPTAGPSNHPYHLSWTPPTPPPQPSPPRRSRAPFRAADSRPAGAAAASHDGLFRVIVVATGAPAAADVPSIVAALSKDHDLALQIITTPQASHFFTQSHVDAAVRRAWHLTDDSEPQDIGVSVWTDADQFASWRQPGDPELHLELGAWADLVIVAPCSAATLAKVAFGDCDGLALATLRALHPHTPVIICPATDANTWHHPATTRHLSTIQNELLYVVLGPQTDTSSTSPGRPTEPTAVGAMKDWRDIVIAIQDMAALFRTRVQQHAIAEAALAQVDANPATTTVSSPSTGDSNPADTTAIAVNADSDPTATDPMPDPYSPATHDIPDAFRLMRPIWGEATMARGAGGDLQHAFARLPLDVLPLRHGQAERDAAEAARAAKATQQLFRKQRSEGGRGAVGAGWNEEGPTAWPGITAGGSDGAGSGGASAPRQSMGPASRNISLAPWRKADQNWKALAGGIYWEQRWWFG